VASLMEILIDTLDQECKLYEQLLGLSSKKTPIIVSGDLNALANITDEEQSVVAKIQATELARQDVMRNIAGVLNKDVNTLKLTELIQLMSKRPAEKQTLAKQRDRLKLVADNVRRVNDQNQQLLKSSLEMVQFEMNILQSARRSPETANYSKEADIRGDVIGINTGRFDAKQ